MIVIGLTGSIGTGKSTAARMLETLGVPVHDADTEVHRLLLPDSPAMPALAAAFPYFEHPQLYGRKIRGRRALKRDALGRLVFKHPEQREKLERIIHPYVREAQTEFIRRHKALGMKIVALDIPLLFETGGENLVNYTVTMSAPYFIQRARVLLRPGMSEEKFHAILSRQMPDHEKTARADFVVHSGLGHAYTMRQIKNMLEEIKAAEGMAS